MSRDSASHSHRPRRAFALGLLLALLAGLVATVGTGDVARAASASGKVRGAVVGSQHGAPKVTVSWFTQDWTFVGSRKAYGGVYSLSLAPGTYHLQFTDQRPAYDVTKYRPSDALVRVAAGRTVLKNIKMHRGASLGGKVRTGGRPGAGARVVAANADEQSFETTADKSGSYALGGLPPGKYSVFTYDAKHAFVGRSSYVKKLKGSSFHPLDVDLKQKAGTFLVDLYAGDQPYPGKAYPTAISLKTGQFWTAKASRGQVTFRGLYPGKYKIVLPGAGNYLGATVKVSHTVRAGKVSFGSARLTTRGATITGRVVDANHPDVGLANASVQLFDKAGKQVATTTSGSSGSFALGGQLSTQSGLSVVVGPNGGSPYLGQGTSYCKYRTLTVGSIAVSTGHQRALGDLALPHQPNADQDGQQCWSNP